jgi:hypothetical protein
MFPDYRCWFETDSAASTLQININYRGVQQLPLLLFAKLNKRPYNTIESDLQSQPGNYVFF